MKIRKFKHATFVRFQSPEYSISDLLNSNNPQLLKDLSKANNTHGIYFLYKSRTKGTVGRKKLYYVGKSRPNILGRIRAHTKDRHKGLWDSFTVITVKPKYVKLLEAIIIYCAYPTGNTKMEKIKAMKNSGRSFI